MPVIRLDRFLGKALGIGRREIQRIVRSRVISLNGVFVADPSMKVNTDKDSIIYRDEELEYREFVYLILNKPQDVICSTEDELHSTVLDLLPQWLSHRKLFSCGRLDRDTTGLVLLTDDGKWCHKIISPKKKCPKVYSVTSRDPVPASVIEEFRQGVLMDGDDKITLPAKLEIISNHLSQLTLHEGRFHQVKRMFKAVGNEVVALHRDSIGGISLPEKLQPGEFQLLSDSEKDEVFV